MNVEKSLLAVSIVFLLGVSGFFAMKSYLQAGDYDVSKVYISRSLLMKGEHPAEAYRLSTRENPFRERTATARIEVEMELPPVPVLKIERPPVIWRRDT